MLIVPAKGTHHDCFEDAHRGSGGHGRCRCATGPRSARRGRTWRRGSKCRSSSVGTSSGSARTARSTFGTSENSWERRAQLWGRRARPPGHASTTQRAETSPHLDPIPTAAGRASTTQRAETLPHLDPMPTAAGRAFTRPDHAGGSSSDARSRAVSHRACMDRTGCMRHRTDSTGRIMLFDRT